MNSILNLLGDKIDVGFFKVSSYGRILSISSSVPRLFGYTQNEFMKIKFEDLFADPFMKTHLMLKLAQATELQEERILLRKQNGKNFWSKLVIQSGIEKEQPIFVGLIEDISTVVQLEDNLRKSENDYQRAKSELDRFIYSASHDIRSPVSSILGLINIMKLDYTDEKSQKFIELLEVSVKRLDRFITELSSFAENSQKAIKSNQIDFEKIVPDILNRLKNHEAFDSIKISYEIDGDSLFYSDLIRIRIILTQLIKNAYDFYDPNKHAPLIAIQIKIKPYNTVIELIDNGIGIAEVHMDKVFEMFYRGSSTSQGSGMGLYVTREAVTRLGGMISINSQLGVGTSVRVELPNSNKGKVASNKRMLKNNTRSQQIQ